MLRGCHEVMDPIGLGLENFDGIGAFRTTDGGRPIDASGELDGVAFGGPRELATATQESPRSPRLHRAKRLPVRGGSRRERR